MEHIDEFLTRFDTFMTWANYIQTAAVLYKFLLETYECFSAGTVMYVRPCIDL